MNSKIEKLAWFVSGDPAKIRQLQSKLNQQGVGEHLTEDGVYGKKTDGTVDSFMKQLSTDFVRMQPFWDGNAAGK